MDSFAQFESTGNIELLSRRVVALFASRETPKELYPRAEALFKKLLDMPIALAGGWQAPLEKHLLSRVHPAMRAGIIYYLAEDINQFVMKDRLKAINAESKLLLVSPGTRNNRPSREDIDRRDNLMISQVNSVLFLYISPGGRLESHFNQLVSNRYAIQVMEHPYNANYISPASPGVNVHTLSELV